jgi:hypothetical protein
MRAGERCMMQPRRAGTVGGGRRSPRQPNLTLVQHCARSVAGPLLGQSCRAHRGCWHVCERTLASRRDLLPYRYRRPDPAACWAGATRAVSASSPERSARRGGTPRAVAWGNGNGAGRSARTVGLLQQDVRACAGCGELARGGEGRAWVCGSDARRSAAGQAGRVGIAQSVPIAEGTLPRYISSTGGSACMKRADGACCRAVAMREMKRRRAATR